MYAQQLHAYTQAKREAAAQQQALLLTPRLSIGSMFASRSWAVADHLLYTVSYLHKGDPRRWYGVSSGDADAFEVCVLTDVCSVHVYMVCQCLCLCGNVLLLSARAIVCV